MSDILRRSLARAAGDGDINAARRLLALLRRENPPRSRVVHFGDVKAHELWKLDAMARFRRGVFWACNGQRDPFAILLTDKPEEVTCRICLRVLKDAGKNTPPSPAIDSLPNGLTPPSNPSSSSEGPRT